MAELDLVWAQLKGTNPGSLDDARLNGFTRTLSGSGLARVNPFFLNVDVEGTNPYGLDEWVGYLQNAFPTRGGSLLVTPGYGEFEATWVRPDGYTRALDIVDQRLYFNSMGTSEDLNVNPFTGSFAGAGDGTSYVHGSVTPGNYYAVGVKQLWDDSDEIFICPDASAYEPHPDATPLIGAGAGVSSGKIYGLAPTMDSWSQSPDRSSCLVGSDVTLSLNWTMEGPSTGTLEENVNGTGWTLLDSSIPAGSTGASLTRASNNDYEYRLRYNDVSTVTWSNVLLAEPMCDNL